MRILFLFLFLSIAMLSAEVLTFEKVLQNRKAIQLFEQEEYEKAEELFQENAMRYPRQGEMHFNQGNALYKAGKIEEAEKAYELALRDSDFSEKSKLFHNLGNVKFEQEDFKNALDYYRNALLENPNNEDSRYNYELASQFLQRQQQQPQSSESDDKDDDEDEQEEQQQQQQPQEGEEEQEQEERQQELTEEEKQQLEDAEQILRALQQREQELLKEQETKTDAEKKGRWW